MYQKIKTGILWLIILFMALFIGRLSYLMATYKDTPPPELQIHSQVMFSEIASVKYESRNYVREKIAVQQPVAGHASPVEQQYEKIASLSASTGEYEKDEASLRGAIREKQAVIQYEEKRGLPGDRLLKIVIGVAPEKFDDMVEQVRKVGKILSIEITKTDKTGEYRALLAKRATLDKTKKSILSLKSKSGKIDEFINLENKIMEIDKELQGLGVQIGDFEDVAELCTVKLSIVERVVKVSFWSLLLLALGWAVEKTVLVVFLAAVALGSILVILTAVEKGKALAASEKMKGSGKK